MRLALAQINTTVGDLEGNRERILSRLNEAREAAADLVLFPELATTGYPPEDLLLRPGFVRAARSSLERIAAECTGITALVGTPWFDRDLANACAVCADGRVQAVYRKHFLPNYGVCDEHIAVEEEGPHVDALDRKRTVERRRHAQRDLHLVGVDERGQTAARVPPVRRGERPPVPPRQDDLHGSQPIRLR